MKTKACDQPGHIGPRELPLAEFWDKPRSPGGRDNACSACRRRQENLRNHVYREVCLYRYGRVCSCPVAAAEGLEIDHIDGNSPAQGLSGTMLHAWLINNGLPDGFQMLCRACNRSKGPYRGLPPGPWRRSRAAGRACPVRATQPDQTSAAAGAARTSRGQDRTADRGPVAADRSGPGKRTGPRSGAVLPGGWAARTAAPGALGRTARGRVAMITPNPGSRADEARRSARPGLWPPHGRWRGHRSEVAPVSLPLSVWPA